MKYVIVFDLDETLGSFKQINYLWHTLKKIYYFINKKEINNNFINNIFDLYPEFIRPNLLQILKFLIEKKKEKKCSNIIIYTNNKTSKEWVTLIQNYFNEKLNYNLFDKIICAFKINNIKIEDNRTSSDKSFNDLIKCSYIDPNSNICFIDDKYYKEMNKNNILYIKVRKFIYTLDKNTLFKRLYESKLVKENKISSKVIKNLENNYKFYSEYENEDIIIHSILAKKLFNYINNFFSKKKTLKKKLNYMNNFTKRQIKNI